MEKLKPCPFCGSKAELMEWEWGDCHSEINYGVGCTHGECWAEISSDNCYHKTSEEAAKAWNTRAEDKEE